MSKSVIIEKYNPQWPVFFEKEAQKIKSVMKENIIEIHHVGSTSVPFLAAKPIIDIILATRDLNSARKISYFKRAGISIQRRVQSAVERFVREKRRI